jgi:hypothetical protein
MNFDKQSDDLMKPFLKLFGSYGMQDTTNDSYKIVLSSLFDDLINLNKTTPMLAKPLILEDSFVKPDIYPTSYSKYFPTDIKDFIDTTKQKQYIYTVNVDGHDIRFCVTAFDRGLRNELQWREELRRALVWLKWCYQYSDTSCNKSLDVFIYLTPFTKLLPSNNNKTLSATEVNTAYTIACMPKGCILIYREEEWFKVLMHESFHAFSLDMGLDDSTRDALRRLFPIDSEFLASEAYAETWARIMNCVFASFYSLPKKPLKATFLIYVDFCLQLERLFSLYQCAKILCFMGLSYDDLHGQANHLRSRYREETHVFEYYVLTSILVGHFPEFLVWCQNNNANIIRFRRERPNYIAFIDFVKRFYKNTNITTCTHLNELSGRHKKLHKTTRMSLIKLQRPL